MEQAYLQQGDVMIKRCGVKGVFSQEYASIPEDSKLIAGHILYVGQNNTHAFSKGKFEILEKEDVRFIRVIEPSTLSHGEHGDTSVEPGEYFLDIVKEYDHLTEESRRVID